MQRPLLRLDARYERANFFGHEVVNPHRNAAPSGLLYELGGFLDRLRPVHFRPFGARGSPGDVDGRAGRAQLNGYPAPRASGRTGDQRDPASERFFHPALQHATAPNRVASAIRALVL